MVALCSHLTFADMNRVTEALNRLAEMEDKIESGELCDSEEVRKETAREILQILYNRTKNYYGNRITLTSDNVKEFVERYGIDLEEQR